MLLVLYFVFFNTGFFSSPLWIPCLLAMLCVVIGRSAWYIHREKIEATTRLNATEIPGTVLQRLKSSILYSLIPALLFYFLYAILMSDMATGEALFLGGAFLACVADIFYFFNWDIYWLLHPVTSRLQARKQQQNPPLQQQMHRHP